MPMTAPTKLVPVEPTGLLPCPFCGEVPLVRRSTEEYPAEGDLPAGEYEIGVQICCDHCGIEQCDEYRADAIAAWNRRIAPQPPVAADVVVTDASAEWLRVALDDALAVNGRLRERLAAALAATPAEPATDERVRVLTGEPTTLADCPIGLFKAATGMLCLKTEYGNNDGRIDAFIVDSGEFFWGEAPQTIQSQRAQIVCPVTALAQGEVQS